MLLSLGVLMAKMTSADSSVTNNGAVDSTTLTALFIVVDGIPKDVIERVLTPGIDSVAADVKYQWAYVGG